jgi:hypothetical protein
MTLALAGYRFGESNHAVYLIEALRQNDPTLLVNDWWTRSTLQYHFVFNRLAAWLMRVEVIEPVFLAGYVALAVLLHTAWRRITLTLGGDDGAYLASVVIFHLLAAGTGLGMYHFLQDSSFLPSNIANVAMLWGACFWIGGRVALAGLAHGLAGLFHLNHALAGIGLWTGWMLLPLAPSPPYAGERAGVRGASSEQPPLTPTLSPGYRGEGVVGTILLLLLCAPAIAPALKAVLAKTSSLPLSEFVFLYVRLRHPHHYDPSSWPAALWLSFLLPLLIAIPAYRIAMRENPSPKFRRAAQAFVLFCLMLLLALVAAGAWYLSEPLIQMSLYRFSIYTKLLSCVATAWLFWRSEWWRGALRIIALGMLVAMTVLIAANVNVPRLVKTNAFPLWLFALLATAALLRPRVLGWGRQLFGTLAAVCVIVSLILSWNKLGVVHPGSRGDDASYLAVCQWARDHTPADAVFLVPPDEQSFRLHARRAIVVNFKNVPQLSGELGEWRDRLQNVLALDDVRRLPAPFHKSLDAIRLRYTQLPTAHLVSAAKRYRARYVVSLHPLDTAQAGEPLFSTPDAAYFLYDLVKR